MAMPVDTNQFQLLHSPSVSMQHAVALHLMMFSWSPLIPSHSICTYTSPPLPPGIWLREVLRDYVRRAIRSEPRLLVRPRYPIGDRIVHGPMPWMFSLSLWFRPNGDGSHCGRWVIGNLRGHRDRMFWFSFWIWTIKWVQTPNTQTVRRVSCEYTGNIKIRSKSGTSVSWYGLHIDDVAGYGAIDAVKIKSFGKSSFDTTCTKQDGPSYWVCSGYPLSTPLSVQLTNDNGETLTCDGCIETVAGGTEWDFGSNFVSSSVNTSSIFWWFI